MNTKFTFKDFVYCVTFLTISYGLIYSYLLKDVAIAPVKAQASQIISPIPTATPTPILVPQGKEAIAQYIREVFGQYADRAFLLLTCENSDWVTDIENNAGNTPSDSYDVGLFQVNTHWQGVTNRAFLTDYRINTLMAYSIFSRDGYSFHQWTCGRKLGI